MTIEERYNRAMELIQNGHLKGGTEEMEQLAQETGDIQAILAAIIANLDISDAEFIDGNYSSATMYADRTLAWVTRCRNNKKIMNAHQGKILKAYAEAQCMKGTVLFIIDENDMACLSFFEEAEKYGDPEALFMLGSWYTKNPRDSDDLELLSKALSKSVYYLEQYLASQPEDASPEKIASVCNYLAAQYEEGLGVPGDAAKAQYYRDLAIANGGTPITSDRNVNRTVSYSSEPPKKSWLKYALIAGAILVAVFIFGATSGSDSDEDYSYDNYDEYSEDEYDEYSEDEYDSGYSNEDSYADSSSDSIYSDCVFPYSSEEYIYEEDVAGLTDDELQEAINELYARHGRIFEDEEIQASFEYRDWYYPVSTDIEKDSFNTIELHNCEVLKRERAARET